jgi:hypothetical protein
VEGRLSDDFSRSISEIVTASRRALRECRELTLEKRDDGLIFNDRRRDWEMLHIMSKVMM